MISLLVFFVSVNLINTSWKLEKIDLSRTFDTLNYDLLIAKLHAHGFQHDALKLLLSYFLSDRTAKVNSAFSSWEKLIKGVPRGSVLDHYRSL